MTEITTYRDVVTADGSSGFPAEAGRYHLYAAYVCPYAQRTLIVRELKGLQNAISISIISYLQGPDGWQFSDDKPNCIPDSLFGAKTMKELYLKINPEYKGRFSVPMLYDKVKKTIVNNESLDICKMLNNEFNALCATPEQAALDLYPEALRAEIDEACTEWATKMGVAAMTCGNTKDQEVYDKNVELVFNTFDHIDALLGKQRYLVGDGKILTLADVCQFVHLVRFDWCFYLVWKCDKKRVLDYPNLWPYLRDLYQTGTIASTVHKEHIRGSMGVVSVSNPNGIRSIGPTLNFLEPHGREHLSK